MDKMKVIALIVKFAARATAALRDGRITPDEAADLVAQGYRIIDAVMDLVQPN